VIRLGLIGPGKVGRSLVQALPRERYALGPVLGKGPSTARRLVRDLRLGRAETSMQALAECNLILVATPESAAPELVSELEAGDIRWSGKCLLYTYRRHSPELSRLAELGASVAGCYPLQTFRRAQASLRGVHFVLEGDPAAVRAGRSVVRAVGGQSHVVTPQMKVQASIASSMVSDAVAGVLEVGVGRLVAAGFSRRRAVEAIFPIVSAILEDCRRGGGRSSQPLPGEPELFERLAASYDQEAVSDEALYRRALQTALEALEVKSENSPLVSPVELGQSERTGLGG